jgi:hypothetical protein
MLGDVEMFNLLKAEVARYLDLLERGEFTPEMKKLGATIRQHSIILEKENKPQKAE